MTMSPKAVGKLRNLTVHYIDPASLGFNHSKQKVKSYQHWHLPAPFSRRRVCARLRDETLPAVCNRRWCGIGHFWEWRDALSCKASATPGYPRGEGSLGK